MKIFIKELLLQFSNRVIVFLQLTHSQQVFSVASPTSDVHSVTPIDRSYNIMLFYNLRLALY